MPTYPNYYIVTIDSQHIRDAQICINPDQMENDENWIDGSGEFYHGLWKGTISEDDIKRIAKDWGVTPESIVLRDLNELLNNNKMHWPDVLYGAQDPKKSREYRFLASYPGEEGETYAVYIDILGKPTRIRFNGKIYIDSEKLYTSKEAAETAILKGLCDLLGEKLSLFECQVRYEDNDIPVSVFAKDPQDALGQLVDSYPKENNYTQHQIISTYSIEPGICN
jgi:hypothetical protein